MDNSPLVRLSVVLLLALATIACGPRTRRELRYTDPIVTGQLSSSQGAVKAGPSFCNEENRYAIEVAPGETLTTEVELGEAARLLLGGCVKRSERFGHRPTDQDRFHLTIEPLAGGPAWQREIALPKSPSAFAEELAVELPPGRVRLTLTDDRQSLRRVFLRDLAFRGNFEQPFKKPPMEKPSTGAATARPEARQVLLISVDTFREDGIAALGGPWPTPHLDRFVAGAQVWSPHYAAASWTKPSHASLLTGFSPLVTGADGFETTVPAALPLLSERFQKAGFATAGLVTDCLWLNPSFGFGRGYDDYRAVPWNLPQMRRQAVDWLADHRGEPFFFFFHTFEVHSDFRHLPYEAPSARLSELAERFDIPDYGCRQGHCASGLLAAINEGQLAPQANEAEILRYLYGESVRHVDEELGALFADLESLGLLDSLLVVLTADHGEAFLEHGELLHGSSWNEVLRVPLVIKWPHGQHAGERGRFVTSSLDVAPTVLAAAGLPVAGLPGQDLAAARGPRPVFSWGPGSTLVAGSWKATLDAAGPQDHGSAQLFDLASDPGERRDLAPRESERLSRMLLLLAQERQRDEAAAGSLGVEAEDQRVRPVTEEERRRLRALGYVGDGH